MKNNYPSKRQNPNIQEKAKMKTLKRDCFNLTLTQRLVMGKYDKIATISKKNMSANLITSRIIFFFLMKSSNKHLWFKLLEPFLLPRLFLILKRGEDGIASFVTVL